MEETSQQAVSYFEIYQMVVTLLFPPLVGWTTWVTKKIFENERKIAVNTAYDVQSNETMAAIKTTLAEFNSNLQKIAQDTAAIKQELKMH